jgi:hypothetical protein
MDNPEGTNFVWLPAYLKNGKYNLEFAVSLATLAGPITYPAGKRNQVQAHLSHQRFSG